MRVLTGSTHFSPATLSPVVTLGNFDGVHLGHQEIMRRLRERASAAKGVSVVYTFEPHPTRVLAPHQHLPMLQTREQKIETLAALGIDILIIEPFTRDFAQMSAEDFLETILAARLHPAGVIVGYDFTFGRHRSGTVEKLEKFGERHGIKVEIVDALFQGEALLSSTHIRRLVERGSVESANTMIGRAYEIRGTVEARRGIGKKLGIPTANLRPESEIIPGSGVYITETDVEQRRYPSVTNIGFNPTVGDSPLSIETHILDFAEEIVGSKIQIRFHRKIRDERKFATTDDLVTQIKNDIDEAKRYYAHTPL